MALSRAEPPTCPGRPDETGASRTQGSTRVEPGLLPLPPRVTLDPVLSSPHRVRALRLGRLGLLLAATALGCERAGPEWLPPPPLTSPGVRLVVVDETHVFELAAGASVLPSESEAAVTALGFECPSARELGFELGSRGLRLPAPGRLRAPDEILSSVREAGALTGWREPERPPTLPFELVAETPCTRLEARRLELSLGRGGVDFAVPWRGGVLAGKTPELLWERGGGFEVVALSSATPARAGLVVGEGELWLYDAGGRLRRGPLEPFAAVESNLQVESQNPARAPCSEPSAVMAGVPERAPEWLLVAESSGSIARYHRSERRWSVVRAAAGGAGARCPFARMSLPRLGEGELALTSTDGLALILVSETQHSRVSLPSADGVEFRATAIATGPSALGPRSLVLADGNGRLLAYHREDGRFEWLLRERVVPDASVTLGVGEPGFVFWHVNNSYLQWHAGFGACQTEAAPPGEGTSAVVANDAGWLVFPSGGRVAPRFSVFQLVRAEDRCSVPLP